MPHFSISGSVDPLLSVRLDAGESIFAETNAMVCMDTHIELKGKARGGLLQSLARKCLNDESLFEQRFCADDRPGEVLLAPNLPGDIRILDVGARQYRLADGAFLASTEGVTMSIKRQSIGKALLANSGGWFVMCTEGQGQVAVSGFGSVREIEVQQDRPITVDNGHLVAWDANLEYELSLNTSKSGLFGKLLHSQTTGEGLVLKFRGNGKILVCSRNKGGFLDWITGNMPENKAAKNTD